MLSCDAQRGDHPAGLRCAGGHSAGVAWRPKFCWRRAAVLVAMGMCAHMPLASSFVLPAGLVARARPGARCARALGTLRPALVARRAVEVAGVDGATTEGRGAISPQQARRELEELARDGRWEKEEVVGVLQKMQARGEVKPLFNSSAILFRRTTANEIQMLTRGTIKPGTIDLNGDDDMEVLNQVGYLSLDAFLCATLYARARTPAHTPVHARSHARTHASTHMRSHRHRTTLVRSYTWRRTLTRALPLPLGMQAFYATLFSSMFLSTVAATLIPDVPDLPFLRDSVLRFVVTFGIGAVPFAFLGAGLSVPGLLQAGLIQVRRLINDEFRQRLIVHEAGHLLVGESDNIPAISRTQPKTLHPIAESPNPDPEC